MKDVIDLVHQIGKLKEVKRSGWVLKNVPNPESVADHSFRTSILAFLLADKFNLDKNKCIHMALFHDVGESLIGDITPHDNISNDKKYALEKDAMITLFSNIDDSVIDLWEEYEKRESPESKFIYELDKIEMLLQAFEYEQKHKNIDLDEFWTYVDRKVKDPKIIEILEILKEKKGV